MRPILLLSFGNPLLDMTIVVKDTSIHQKFKLPTDGQLEVTKEQEEIFEIAMKRDDIEYTAGGCALNTSRVFSWVLGQENRVLFVGGIGKDEIANKLMNIIKQSGVISRLVEVKHLSSGSCVALVLGTQRCLCANIGAASVCKPQHVFDLSTDLLIHPMDSIPVIYLEGYFIPHSFDTALKVAKYCKKNGKIFIFNLCGSYVCENNANELNEILPLVDVVFGYIEEYWSLNKFVNISKLCKNYSKDNDNIVHHLNRIFKSLNGKEKIIKKSKKCMNGNSSQPESCPKNDEQQNHVGKHEESAKTSPNGTANNSICSQSKYWRELKDRRLVVVTQGPSPLLYATDKQVYEHPVAPFNPSLIVDTTGAGDSFVGGFLAAAAVGEELETCLDCGVWAAQQLLQKKGCTIPQKAANFL